MSAYDLATQLGKEVTETAVLRSLTELWQHLRVIPIPQPDGQPTLWELTTTRFTKQIKAGANAGQPTALSALISLYLGQAIVASEDDIETFLSPIAARSRIRDVVHALISARQIETIAVEGKTVLHVNGELPAFLAAPVITDETPGTIEVAAADDSHPKRKSPASASSSPNRARPALDFVTKPFGAPDRERRPFKRDAASDYSKPWDEEKRDKSVRRPKSFQAAPAEAAVPAKLHPSGKPRASPASTAKGSAHPSEANLPSAPVPVRAEIAPPSAATAAPAKADHPVASTRHGPIQAPTTPAHRARPSRSRERSTASAKASPANPSVEITTPVRPVAISAIPALRAASTPPVPTPTGATLAHPAAPLATNPASAVLASRAATLHAPRAAPAVLMETDPLASVLASPTPPAKAAQAHPASAASPASPVKIAETAETVANARGPPFRKFDAPRGNFSDRPARPARSDAPTRSYGDKPSGGFAAKKPYGKPSGGFAGKSSSYAGKSSGSSFAGKKPYGKSAAASGKSVRSI